MPQAGIPSGNDLLIRFDSGGLVATSVDLLADLVGSDELPLLFLPDLVSVAPGSGIDSGSAGRGCTPFHAGIRAFSCANPSGVATVALPQVSIRRAKYDLFASGRVGSLRSVALRASPVTEKMQESRFPVFAVPFSHLEISGTQFATKDRASFDGKF